MTAPAEQGIAAIRAYDLGYDQGYEGQCLDVPDAMEGQPAERVFIRGWEDGEGDRPTLDELTLDPDKERTDPLGY